MQPIAKFVPAPATQADVDPRVPGARALGSEFRAGLEVPDRPGEPAEARDAVLRALAQRFYPGVPVSTQAARIHALAETYAVANWARDRDRLQLPAGYRDTRDEYLWAAFKSGAPMALAPRDLRRILIGAADNDG